MRTRTEQRQGPAEVVTAIGLVWGHLNAQQFSEAYTLGKVCTAIWPQEERLAMMVAYAQVELFDHPDAATMAVLRSGQCPEWLAVVARRAGVRLTDAAGHALGAPAAPAGLPAPSPADLPAHSPAYSPVGAPSLLPSPSAPPVAAKAPGLQLAHHPKPDLRHVE